MARKLDRNGGLYGFNFDDLDITRSQLVQMETLQGLEKWT